MVRPPGRTPRLKEETTMRNAMLRASLAVASMTVFVSVVGAGFKWG